jgi:hypothetical protein
MRLRYYKRIAVISVKSNYTAGATGRDKNLEACWTNYTRRIAPWYNEQNEWPKGHYRFEALVVVRLSENEHSEV